MIDVHMFKRFVTFDRAFQVRAGIIVVLLLLISWEGRQTARQEKLLTRLSAEQALVAKIPDMKAALAALAGPQAVVPGQKNAPRPDDGFHLQGILIQNNEWIALVNGEPAAVGAVIGKYEIVQITPTGVSLSNRDTNEIKVISLPTAPWEN